MDGMCASGSPCVSGEEVCVGVCTCVLACMPRERRYVHVGLRARHLLNVCFVGPWGPQLAELPALRAVFLTAQALPLEV